MLLDISWPPLTSRVVAARLRMRFNVKNIQNTRYEPPGGKPSPLSSLTERECVGQQLVATQRMAYCILRGGATLMVSITRLTPLMPVMALMIIRR